MTGPDNERCWCDPKATTEQVKGRICRVVRHDLTKKWPDYLDGLMKDKPKTEGSPLTGRIDDSEVPR